MKTYGILFLIGKDRPGIVDDLSTFLFERGVNIEDSRMAALGGRFSIVTLFSCSPEKIDAVKADLDRLRGLGFEISLHRAEDPAAVPQRAELPLRIRIVAMDHPGIVQRIVHILAGRDINIQALNTEVVRAPLSGAPLFDLSIDAGVPSGVAVSEVKGELAELAAEQNLDLSFVK
jgi:glycine cleavage system transcriptional repressor